MTLSITSAFDAGNIGVLSVTDTSAELEIRPDRQSDFYQWFHFRVGNGAGRELTLTIVNCAGAAYPGGWPGYQARASEDREEWTLAPTEYADGRLTIRVTPRTNGLWVAYFAPYPLDRHYDLIAGAAACPGVEQVELGRTLDGRPLDMLRLGEGARQVWLYARQHPGETMAQWWMEGAIERLTDSQDSIARRLRAAATFHIVPNMNPDGSFRGHLRTNAAGVNLNREWAEPSMERSPEVFLVRREMDRTGVHFAMDVHGDEAIPAVFIAGFEGIPDLRPGQLDRFSEYCAYLDGLTPDFQCELGYPVAAPGKANLAMSTAQLAQRYGAVSMTLEMPFKDNRDLPDATYGWSPARSVQLGRDCLTALAHIVDRL